MIITDTQPYSMVEDKGFLALMKFAFPHYKVPCRNYFVSYIEKLYEEKVKVLTEKLKETAHVALTTDLWSSLYRKKSRYIDNIDIKLSIYRYYRYLKKVIS
jgi:hypothetical protein